MRLQAQGMLLLDWISSIINVGDLSIYVRDFMNRITSIVKNVLVMSVLVAMLAGCSGSADVKPDMDGASSTAQFMKAKAAYLAYDFPVAFPLMLKEANGGNPNAQYAVGYMYFYGQGVVINYEESLKWIRKAAEQGNKKAFKALAIVNSQRKRAEEPVEKGQ